MVQGSRPGLRALPIHFKLHSNIPSPVPDHPYFTG